MAFWGGYITNTVQNYIIVSIKLIFTQREAASISIHKIEYQQLKHKRLLDNLMMRAATTEF